MVFEIHTPSLPLSEFIENIVYYEGYSAEHLVDKLLPDGTISIIMDMCHKPNKLYNNLELTSFTEFKGSFISGQHKGYMLIEADHSSMMVTRFKLGGAFPFFNFPISNLNDKVQQLEPLIGDSIELIRMQIISEKVITKKFSLLENYLISKIRPEYETNASFSNALGWLLENPESVTTVELAKRIGVSQKHVISLFDKRVGLNPKALARIFRFQKVIKSIEVKSKLNWSDIAHDCGYYDQAHFIKDFFVFSGINPSDYPDMRGEYLNYIPIGKR